MAIPFHAPCIEPESVLSALEAMRQGKKLYADHPLTHFLSIQSSYPLPSIAEAALTQVRIYSHLSHIIHAELNRHRSIYQLDPVAMGEGVSTLEADFQTLNEELQAWSLLYHRYVRVDLNLTLRQIEPIVAITERTLNRRQELGIFRLTNRLHEIEIHKREENHKVALRQHLPNADLIFVGREREIAWAVSQLHNEQVRRIMLTGPSGSGKSALAVKLALLTIDKLTLYNVAWIDQPALIPSKLLEQIVGALGLPLGGDPRYVLQSYLSHTRSLIVIDNAHDMVEEPAALDSVLRCLDDALLIICSRKMPPHLPAIPISTLPDLDQDAVYALFEKFSDLYPPVARKFAHFDELYLRVGGNPGALREEFSGWYGDKNYRQAANRFALVWPLLSSNAQLTWIILAIVADTSYLQSHLSSVLQTIPVSEVLQPLWEYGVVTLDAGEEDTEITLASLARTYVELLMDTADFDLRSMIYRTIKRLADYLAIYQDGVSCVRMLKAAMRVTLPSASSLDLAHTFIHTIERTGQWTIWIDYLTALLNKVEGADRLWVLNRLGVANRQLGHSEEAAYYLTEALEQAGAQGNFAYQVEVLVELAVLFRSRLNYAATKKLLSQAAYLNQRYQQPGMTQRIELEHFQLAMIEQSPDTLPILSLTESTPHLMYLTAQIELLQGHFDDALVMAQTLYDQLPKDDPKYPRVVALLGRIHFEQKEWDSAVNEISWAIQAMESRQDITASVHAKINLAIMYLQQQKPQTALKYLQSLPIGY